MRFRENTKSTLNHLLLREDIMTNTNDRDFFSPDSIHAGFSGKRAQTALYLIEVRTVAAANASRRAAQAVPYPVTASEQGLAYLDAFAMGEAEGSPDARPSIQQLEQYVMDWAELVPDNASYQATLAHLLGQRYVLSHQHTPGIRAALGLDRDPVKVAYQRLYGKPLDAIYTPDVPPTTRLAWVWERINSRLENLPTFWVTFALTLPIGPGLLAMPIALAKIGTLPGVVLLVCFGLINLLTVAMVAEVHARHGGVRFGNAFFGGVVGDYLGGAASSLLTAVFFINCFLVLMVFYLGIASTLESATGLPAAIWALGVFLVGVFFMSRGSLNATIASSLIISAVIIGSLLLLAVLAVPHIKGENLAYLNVPLLNGAPLDVSLIQSVVGTMMSTFFGHMAVGNYAKVALKRDPSGKSFMHGSMAAILVTIIFSVIWLVVINGSIAPDVLAAEPSTSLVPLGRLVGASVHVVGAIFAILSLGIASIHVSFYLFYTALEPLPTPGKAGGGAWLVGTRWGRFAVGLSPIVLAFALTLIVFATGSASFTGLLSFLGALALSMFASIYPALLIYASRRKGDLVPGKVYHILGNPIFLAALYLFFMGIIFLHGLVIYQDAASRAGALAVGLATAVATVIMFQRGAFAARLVVELRQDAADGQQARLNVVSAGKPISVEVRALYATGEEQAFHTTADKPLKLTGLRSLTCQLSTAQSRQLKVWAHDTTLDPSVGVPLTAEIKHAEQVERFDLAQSNGVVIVPLRGSFYELRLVFV
jgi:amino acid permease